MTHMQDHFLIWLRDAHAMENQAIAMIRAQIKRIENYPDFRARLERHLAETEDQAARLKALLDRYPGGASTVKDLAARIAATTQGVGGLLAGDEIIKAAKATYAFEHAEIAHYRVLAAAADELGDTEAKTVFEEIMEQERAMAEWLDHHLDVVTRIYLMRDERDLQAKR